MAEEGHYRVKKQGLVSIKKDIIGALVEPKVPPLTALTAPTCEPVNDKEIGIGADPEHLALGIPCSGEAGHWMRNNRQKSSFPDRNLLQHATSEFHSNDRIDRHRRIDEKNFIEP